MLFLIIGIIVILVIAILFSGYKKAPPDTAFIISGMRKKIITLRGEYPYADALRMRGSWIIDIVPPCCYTRRTDAVVIDSPTADELMDEIERAGMQLCSPRIVAVCDRYASLALRAFCRCAVSVCRDDGAEGVAAAIAGRRIDSIDLSQREIELIRQMRKGPSNKELSLSLSVSERTVRRIKESVFRKTGLVSGEQLAVFSVYIDQYSQLFTYLG